MMPPPERSQSGYLRRVLADGARRPQIRRAARGLLGAGDGGVAGVSRGPGPGFVYAHPGFRPIETAAESPAAAATWQLDVPDARVATATPAPTPEPTVVATTAGGFDPPAPPTDAQARAVTAAGPRDPPAPAAALPTTDCETSVGRAAPSPPSPAAGSPPPGPVRQVLRPRASQPASIRSRVPGPAADPVDPARPPVRPAPRATLDVLSDTRVDAELAGPARDIARPEPALDVEKLSAPMRALLPLLGRVRVVLGDSPPGPELAAVDPVRGTVAAAWTPAAAGPAESTTRTESRAVVRAANRAGLTSASARAETSAAVAEPLASIGQPNLVPRAPMARQREAARAAPEAPTPSSPPVRRVEHVVTTRVIYRTPPARAYWERRYLGRPHMRPFR